MNHPLPADAALSDLDRQALDWFVRRNRGLTAREKRALRTWLAADPRHENAFTRWQSEWKLLDELPRDGLDALRRALARDKAAEQPSMACACVRSSSAMAMVRAWWLRLGKGLPQAALAVAVLMVAVTGHLAWDHWQRQPVYVQGFETQRGQQLQVDLPDGSQLRLDTATQAEVVLYRTSREVRLAQGQAVFNVQGDPSRPFAVLTGPLRITAVGTRFSVRFTPGIPGEEGVQVSVEEGRVLVSPAADAQANAPLRSGENHRHAVELTAGQKVESDAAGILGQVASIPAAGMAPWIENRVSFDNTPLSQAIAEFERYGPSRLKAVDPAVAALRLTGTFDPRRLDNFIRALPEVLPVRLREQDGAMEILPKK